MNDMQINQAEIYLEEIKRNFPEFKKIFSKATNAEYINENSKNIGELSLYKFILNKQEIIKRYFSIIGYELQLRKGYCYFVSSLESENDEKVDASDRKNIKDIVVCLQIYGLLKNINNNFGLVKGLEFSISSIESAVSQDPRLKTMIKINDKSKESYRKYIEKQIWILRSNGFIEEINKREGTYKTLNSFEVLNELIKSIETPEDSEDE